MTCLVSPSDPPLAHNSLLSNLLDLEHLKVAMANSDKINSSLNFTPTSNSFSIATNNNCNINNIDDVLRQFDSLNIPTYASSSFAGTNHANKNKINSKCFSLVIS